MGARGRILIGGLSAIVAAAVAITPAESAPDGRHGVLWRLDCLEYMSDIPKENIGRIQEVFDQYNSKDREVQLKALPNKNGSGYHVALCDYGSGRRMQPELMKEADKILDEANGKNKIF